MDVDSTCKGNPEDHNEVTQLWYQFQQDHSELLY